MTTNNMLRALPWRVVGVVCIVLGMVLWILPVSLIPFVKVFPYLQSNSDLTIYFGFGLFYSIAIAGARLSMTSSQWQFVKSVAMNSWRDRAAVTMGVLMAVYAAAAFSANTFGLLVKLTPSNAYADTYTIISIRAYGSRSKAVELGLLSEAGNGYSVTFSRRLFEYDEFRIGDEILLRGKQGVFGVYVDRFELLN